MKSPSSTALGIRKLGLSTEFNNIWAWISRSWFTETHFFSLRRKSPTRSRRASSGCLGLSDGNWREMENASFFGLSICKAQKRNPRAKTEFRMLSGLDSDPDSGLGTDTVH